MTEETVNEEKEVVETSQLALDNDTMKIIKDLQGQIDSMKTKDEASLLAQLLDKVGDRGSSKETETGQFDFNKKYSMDDIDDNDVLSLEEQVTFIAHRVYHFICDDQRAGMNVPAPFGVIKFKFESTRAIKGGRETELIQMCTYTCKSRKELEWLRSHSTFGIVFFDKIKGTEYSADIEKSKALARQMVALQGMGQHDLISMARQRGMNPGDMDLASLRASLAINVVDEQFKNKGIHTRNTLIEEHLEATAMGKSGVAG